MDNYIGKHLLVDCYGCPEGSLSSPEKLVNAITQAAEQIGMTVTSLFKHEGENEIVAAAYGEKSHICIHAYPNIGFIAIDIYNFTADLKPAKTMSVLRLFFKPEKIRATSVKRGNINPDMKPATHSKSTALHKFKNTGHQVSVAGRKVAKYFAHKRIVNYQNRKTGEDDMGPE